MKCAWKKGFLNFKNFHLATFYEFVCVFISFYKSYDNRITFIAAIIAAYVAGKWKIKILYFRICAYLFVSLSKCVTFYKKSPLEAPPQGFWSCSDSYIDCFSDSQVPGTRCQIALYQVWKDNSNSVWILTSCDDCLWAGLWFCHISFN